MKSSAWFCVVVSLWITVSALSGCGKAPAPAAASASPAKHEHTAPHGGTPIVLGNELYHLEIVRDAATGTLQAYVLDGEMENFVRVTAPAIEVAVSDGSGPRTLVLKAVANPATGETVGDTSQF